MNKRQALDLLALRHSEGGLSDETLTKACDAYRQSTDLDDDVDYQICVTKSLFDKLRGQDQDAEIVKAILPGQTKVVNGIVYIYTATPNAQTQYDWRVYRGGGVNKNVPEGTAQKRKTNNPLFPNSIDDVKEVVGARVGGSTGAKLVEDSSGNRYIMKRGSNTNNGHIKSEYLATQLYSLLGLKVPEMELYEKDGETFLLSSFVLGCRENDVFEEEDAKEMVKGFAIDVFLANRDVYNNGDNILISPAGEAIRVDNGGSLKFKSKGSAKDYDEDFGKDLDQFIEYNGEALAYLKDADLNNQLEELYSRKDDVIAYLNADNQKTLANLMEKRFESVKKVLDERLGLPNKATRQIQPRVIKTDAEMYRELDEDELNQLWESIYGRHYHKISNISKTGFTILANIAKMRGFDGRPEVISKADFLQKKKDGDFYLAAGHSLYRGIKDDRPGTKNNPNAASQRYVGAFKFDEECFYGSVGVFGAGIYTHADVAPSPQDKTAINHAKEYAYNGQTKGSVFELNLSKDTKIVTVDQLLKDAKEETGNVLSDSKEYADAQKQNADATKELIELREDYDNQLKSISDRVKADMHWDDDVFTTYKKTIEDIRWGDLDSDGRYTFPKFDAFVKGTIGGWLDKLGGKMTKRGDKWTLSLPYSTEEYTLSENNWNDASAIRQKQPMGAKYHIHAAKIARWIETNHFQKIADEIAKESKSRQKQIVIDFETRSDQLKEAIKASEKSMRDISEKLFNPDATLRNGVLKSVVENEGQNNPALGIYAALKGYDAIRVGTHLNRESNEYIVILNRTKVITYDE